MADMFELTPPQYDYANKVKALFYGDQEVRVEFDKDACAVKLYVDNQAKADALARILPTSMDFGGIVVGVQVIPANDDVSRIELFRRAFEGNPNVAKVASEASGPYGMLEERVTFKAKIVQFYNDNLSSADKIYTGTMEQVAGDVFAGVQDVFFSTEAVGDAREVVVWP